MEQSMEAIKFEGVINIAGFLGGQDVTTSIFECLMRVCTARGLVGGNRAMMEDMIAAIEANDIHPVLDPKVFSFGQAKEAYQYLVSTYWQSLKLSSDSISSGTPSILARWL